MQIVVRALCLGKPPSEAGKCEEIHTCEGSHDGYNYRGYHDGGTMAGCTIRIQ